MYEEGERYIKVRYHDLDEPGKGVPLGFITTILKKLYGDVLILKHPDNTNNWTSSINILEDAYEKFETNKLSWREVLKK